MYQVNLGDKILYYPGSQDAVIYDTKLELEVGLAGSFTFKVPPTNPLYDSLANGQLVTVLRDNKEYWRGEINNIRINFAKIAEIYCLEDLSWLGDEFMSPSKVANQSYTQRLSAAISSYNANRSSDKQFTVGYVYNGAALCNWKTEYEWSILDSIRNCICRDNCYVKIRRVTSGTTVTRYIDIVRLEEYGIANSQPIEYGYNLLDYVKDSDYGNLTNVLTPYGDALEDTVIYDDYSQRLQGTTITNAASVSLYGRHAKAVVFDGVTSLTTLNNLASAYLSRYCQPQLTMEVTAVDLSDIEDAEKFNVGDSILILAEPFAINQRLYITQITVDLQKPEQNKIILSGNVVRRTLTSQLQTALDAVEELPDESDILKAAKRNALAMLLDETQGGYVVFEYDSNNTKIQAINICNAQTIAASTKRWRWSQNGFGYMERANTSAAWSSATAKIAITMDGSIVADYITTGTLSADRMRGGTLALGGSAGGAYKNASLNIYNSSNTLIGSWNASGISVKAGTITLGNKQALSDANTGVYIGSDGISAGANSVFKVTSGGALNATNATIQGAITATSGSFTGSITANSGKIGSATSAWNIGSQSIYNGCTGVHNGSAGTYVGIDGIRNNDSNNHYVRITGGQIASNNCDLSGAITATSGAIGGLNISSSGGIDTGLGTDSAFRLNRTDGFLYARLNSGAWGMINTLPNNPPHNPSDGRVTAYIHNGHLCVDNDGSLSEDGANASNQVFVSPFNVSKWSSSDGTDHVIWVNTSDRRKKKDIEDLSSEEIHNFFDKVRPKKFRYNEKSSEDPKPLHYGVIAQDIVEDFGTDYDFTDQNEMGFYHVHYMEFISMNMAGIKELMQTVRSQQTEIELLKEEIKLLKEAVHG